MSINYFKDVGASLTAFFERSGRIIQSAYRHARGCTNSPQQNEDVRQRGRVANPLIILIAGILTTDFFVSEATITQIGFGFGYGSVVSALHIPSKRQTRVKAALALAGVLPGVEYFFRGGLTLHVTLPMTIISAAAGTELQHRLCVRSRGRTVDSVLRPQSSVECLLVTWLIVVRGNAEQVSPYIQAIIVLCMDVLSSTAATRSLTRFFLWVILVTMAVACLVQVGPPYMAAAILADHHPREYYLSREPRVWKAEVRSQTHLRDRAVC